MENKIKNFFLKSSKEKNGIFEDMRLSYGRWKRELQAINKPFFAVHSDFKTLFLKDISGGALKLYMYLGFHAKYSSGELWHSSAEIAQFFSKDQRTIGLWFKELEDRGLIFREQKGFRMKANTFLRPYGFLFDEVSIEDSMTRDVTNNIRERDEEGYTPLAGMLLNHAYKEYAFILINKKEQVYQCSYFLDFRSDDLTKLRTALQKRDITLVNYDIDNSIIASSNKDIALYHWIMKYFEDN